jgi:hypothetical protein
MVFNAQGAGYGPYNEPQPMISWNSPGPSVQSRPDGDDDTDDIGTYRVIENNGYKPVGPSLPTVQEAFNFPGIGPESAFPRTGGVGGGGMYG